MKIKCLSPKKKKIGGTCAEVTSVEDCYQRNGHKQAVTSVIIRLG
jgi:hypothetical protein